LIGSGCDNLPLPLSQKSQHETNGSSQPSCACFSPAKVEVLPLTELIAGSGEASSGCRINLYLSLVDRFGSQVKAPAIFRFELHETGLGAGDPVGTRTIIWPDFDLTSPTPNNRYWRDFLRAYQFELPFQPQQDRNYLLSVTCLLPDGRTLSTQWPLPSVPASFSNPPQPPE